MNLKERVGQKEKTVKSQLEKLRNLLNSKSTAFNQQTDNWSYIAALGFTEQKLQEIIDFIETAPLPTGNR